MIFNAFSYSQKMFRLLQLKFLTSLFQTWRVKPNYSVLVDTRDRTDVQPTYVVEENISVVTDKQVSVENRLTKLHLDTLEYMQPRTQCSSNRET